MVILAIIVGQLGGLGGLSSGLSSDIDSSYVRVDRSWPFLRVESVALKGNTAYVGSEKRVVALDLTGSNKPVEFVVDGTVRDILVAGDVLWASMGSDGLVSIDLSGVTPTPKKENLTEKEKYLSSRVGFLDAKKGHYISAGYANGVALKDNYIFVAVGNSGVATLDVTDPFNPREVFIFDTDGYAADVFVAGNLLVVADGENGIVVLDVSNPGKQKQVQVVDTRGYASSVTVSNGILFVCDGKEGLLAINLTRSDPVVGRFDSPGVAKRVAILGKYAYIADGNFGLRVVNVSNPANMREKAYYNTAGFAVDVTAHGSYAFVADGQYGLLKLENELLKYGH